MVDVLSKLDDVGATILNAITENPVKSAIIGGTALAGTAGIVAVGATVARKKKKAKTKRGRSRDRKFISREKHERAYQRRRKRKGKKTTGKYYKTKNKKTTKKRGRKVYYAKKTGQPYILLRNGQARFIKGKRRKR